MIKNQFISLVFVFISAATMAQADCVLGVGLTEDGTLIEVFQMNEIQQEKLANFGAELKYRNELLNDQ